MINVDEIVFKERNIRLYKNRYVVRFMRRKKTYKEARRLQKFLERFINCVSIYETNTGFMVQTYKEYSNLVDAIKVRNYIEDKLKTFV